MRAYPGSVVDGASLSRRTGWNGAVEAEDLFAPTGSSYWGHSFLRIFLWMVLVSALSYGGWVVWSERGTIQTGDSRVVLAEPGPTKIKPEDPGGMVIPHLDKTVYQSFRPSNPTKNQDSQPLASPVTSAVSPSTASDIPDHWTPVPDASAVVSPDKGSGSKATSWAEDAVIAMSPDMLAAIGSSDPLEGATSDLLPATSDLSSSAGHAMSARSEAPPVAMGPMPAAIAKKPETMLLPEAKSQETKPSEAKSQGARSQEAKPSEAKRSLSSGSWVVQVGAYRTEAEAQAAWQHLRRLHGERVKELRPRIMRKVTKERGTFYRLQLQSGTEQAGSARQNWQSVCQLLGLGRRECFVVLPPVSGEPAKDTATMTEGKRS